MFGIEIPSLIVVMYIWAAPSIYNAGTPMIITGFESLRSCNERIPEVKESLFSAQGVPKKDRNWYSFSARCNVLKR